MNKMANKKIQEFTEETAPAVGDFFLMSRLSDEAYRKVAFNRIHSPNAPQTELGSACTGSSADTGRILTMDNTLLTKAAGFQVFKGGFLLYPDNYNVNHLATNSTITFTTDRVFDTDQITVYYYT